MAEVTLTNGKFKIIMTYTAANGTFTLTGLKGRRTDNYGPSWNASHKKITMTVGGVEKKVTLRKYVKFSNKSQSYFNWQAPTTKWTGLSGTSISVKIKMPSGQAYSGKTFSKSISMSYTTYTVTFKANGGTGGPSSQTKIYGQTLKLSTSKPTRPGYTFMGWGTSASDTSANYAAGGSYTANAAIVLYAIWSKKLTLTYNGNGGSGAPATESKYIYNSAASAAFTLSKSYPSYSPWTFNGWSTSSTANSGSLGGNTITISKDTTVYATWQKTLTITYNANGGTGGPGQQKATVYKSSPTATFTIPTLQPTRPGYTFMGWGTSATDTSVDCSPGSKIAINANKTFYAIWAKTITLSFNPNEGTGGPAAISKTIYNATTAATFTIPTSPNPERGVEYLFKNQWLSTPTGGTVYRSGSNYSFSDNTTIYADWKLNAIPIVYYLYDDKSEIFHQTGNITIGKTAETISQTPKHKENNKYMFEGWVNSVTGEVLTAGTEFTVAAGLYFTAKWKERGGSIIKYDLTGGQDPADFEDQKKIQDIPLTLHSDIPFKEAEENASTGEVISYVFKGWGDAIADPSIIYKAGAIYTKDKNATLYAAWTASNDPITYIITYDTGNGTRVKMQVKEHDKDISLRFNKPTLRGYNFINWNTQPDGSGDWYEPGSYYSANEDLVLYAIWEGWSHVVTYSANGGHGFIPPNQTATIGEKFVVPECELMNVPYIFYGWNTESDGSGKYYFPGDEYTYIQDGGHVVLYAIWRSTDILIYLDGSCRAGIFEEEREFLKLDKNGVVQSIEFIEGNEMKISQRGFYATEFREGEDLWRNY